MKTHKIYYLFLFVLLFCFEKTEAQPNQVINCNGQSGTIELWGNNYKSQNSKITYEINTSVPDKGVTIEFTLDLSTYGQPDIISMFYIKVDKDGNETAEPLNYYSGTTSGSVLTRTPGGRARIEFIPGNCDRRFSNGYRINYSVDQSLISSENLYVKGLIRLGDLPPQYPASSQIFTYQDETSPLYSGIEILNSHTKNRSVYGLNSTVYNGSSGNIYGIYSKVGGKTTGKKWSGYFTGGNLEVSEGEIISGGILRANADVVIGKGGNQFVLRTQQPTSSTPFQLNLMPLKSDGTWDSDKQLRICSDGSLLVGNGNVGIGTLSPQYKLDVKGVIRAAEVKIENVDNFADFVFKPGYAMPNLDEVHAFIQQNGHLPGIPNEAEVKENGINLVEMQVKLLQKIEELTLYMIEQEKRIHELESQLGK